MTMRFVPFVLDRAGNQVLVSMRLATDEIVQQTNLLPQWQTSWTSDFLKDPHFLKYAAFAGSELIALGAYEILTGALVVHIVYMEAHPESNPVLDEGRPKYTGIGKMMIAQGIKLSIDQGFGGDVVLEAKTTSLAEHYVRDFGAVALPAFDASAPRFLIADDAAKHIFFSFLKD